MAAGALSELGTQNYALRIGADACVEAAQRIGLNKIEEQCRSMTEQAASRLVQCTKDPRRQPGEVGTLVERDDSSIAGWDT